MECFAGAVSGKVAVALNVFKMAVTSSYTTIFCLLKL